MHRSTIFFVFCLAFILGVAIHSFFAPDKWIFEPFWWYVGFLTGMVVGIAMFSCSNPSLPAQAGQPPLKLRGREVALCLAFLFLGLFRYAQSVPLASENHVLRYIGREATLRGAVDSWPRVREKTVAYVVQLQSLDGKLLLTSDRWPQYSFGDGLVFTCTPELLGQYEQYLRREGVAASCAFPANITKIVTVQSERNWTYVVQAKLGSVRGKADERVKALFAEPYAGLLAGILYGDTSGFSAQLKNVFRVTGLAHITALSGYNISIISVVLVSGLIYLGLTRKQSLPVTIVLILAFVLATGAEASVVRAAIMGLLAMLAKNIGRISNPRNALVLAGALMLAINPRLLVFDLGFLLSFLATIALIWFADSIKQGTLIRKLPEVAGIREAGAASVAAFLFTTPLILYKTGLFSPLAIIVNILVVPVVPLAMALGFAAIVADFVWHPLGLGAAFLARVPLEYIIKLAEWFAQFGAIKRQVSFAVALILFIAIVIGLYAWKKRTQNAATL